MLSFRGILSPGNIFYDTGVIPGQGLQ